MYTGDLNITYWILAYQHQLICAPLSQHLNLATSFYHCLSLYYVTQVRSLQLLGGNREKMEREEGKRIIGLVGQNNDRFGVKATSHAILEIKILIRVLG